MAENKTQKKATSKPADATAEAKPKRKKASPRPWYQPFEDDILNSVIAPKIRLVFREDDVTSKGDLISKFNNRFSANIDSTRMGNWLEKMGLDTLFDKPRVIRLPDDVKAEPTTADDLNEDLDLPPAARGETFQKVEGRPNHRPVTTI